jgi:nitroreductase
MSETAQSPEQVQFIRKLRQHRQFTDQPVPDDVLQDLLEVARWTGSSKNTQPWELVVVRDRQLIDQIAEYGAFSGFLRNAPVVIVIVLNGKSPRSESYDEGRLTERVMLAAKAYGLGSGTGWWGDAEAARKTKEALGIPQEKDVISGIALGYPPAPQPGPAGVTPGRKPLAEIVHYDRYGNQGS